MKDQNTINQIIKLRGELKSIRDIAAALNISPATVVKYSHEKQAEIDAEKFAYYEEIAMRRQLMRENRLESVTSRTRENVMNN